MFGWWVVLIIVVFQAVGLIVDLRVVYYYMHEDDYKYTQGLVAQVMTLVALQLVWLLFCILPTDAYNAYFDTGLSMLFFWQLICLGLVLVLAIPLPFALFYYEADSDPRLSKSPPWKSAGIKTGIVALCVTAFCGITFLLFRSVTVPQSCIEDPPSADCHPGQDSGPTVNTNIDFLTYLIALPSFVGWFPFALLGGMGTALAPFDKIYAYVHRPAPISQEEYMMKKKQVGERAGLLKGFGEALLNKDAVVHAKKGMEKQRSMYNFKSDVAKYKQVCYLLEEDYNRMEMCMNERGENPFYSYLKLGTGIVFALLTLVWWVQIICYDLIPDMVDCDPFLPWLNNFFIWIRRSKTYILDLLFYFMFCSYLLYCGFIGGARVGMRFQKFFPVEPLAKNQTHLNTLAYHATFMLLQAAAIVQLSVVSLSEYDAQTEGYSIFAAQQYYMKLFSSFYKHYIFQWTLILTGIIALVWHIIWPKPKSAIDFNDPKQLEKWVKLQKQLGIDASAVGAVKYAAPVEPETTEPPAAPTWSERMKGKMARADQALDPSKLGKKVAGAAMGM